MTIRKMPDTRSVTGNTYEEVASAQGYRRPLMVKEIMYYRRSNMCFPVCPRCMCTIEREYMAFCDRCGQRLDWKDFDSAMIWMR